MDEKTQSDAYLEIDLPCVECGYNLKGLQIEGNCPECGLPLRSTFSMSTEIQPEIYEDLFVRLRDLEMNRVAGSSGYPADAFVLVSQAVGNADDYLSKSPSFQFGDEVRHVSAAELCRAFGAFAVDMYGATALEVLREWGIRQSEDIGRIVYRLVEVGHLVTQTTDSPMDFANLGSIEQLLAGPLERLRAEALDEGVRQSTED